MKYIFLKTTFVFLLLLSLTNCSKEKIIRSSSETNMPADFFASRVLSVCDKFNYTDTIFYITKQANNIIHPQIKQKGTYGAFPDGLAIDSASGVININQSETGLKYIVWFKPKNSTDTCKKTLIISGINYLDSIYTLNGNVALAKPLLNALRNGIAGKSHGGGGEDENENEFDDCPDAAQQLGAQGVAIDTATGIIDLQKTVANGVFGATPVSGTFKDFVLNYRLADSSNSALNKISLRLYYFQTRAAIPSSLKKEVAAKNSLVFFTDSPQPNFTGKNFSLTAKEKEVKCRPPYIIVVGK